MFWFGWGALTGAVTATLVALVAGWFTHRRIVQLERRARSAERLAELGTLTGGLAHEIKNPLSTVQLNLQLLAEDLDPEHPGTQRVKNRLATVHRETSRLRDILDDFLRYAGQLELHRNPVDLNELLAELVDFFSPQASLQRVQLRLRKHEPGPLVANVDAKLIKQTLLNLMLNALQAMSARGGDLILSATRDSDHARIDVIDTGTGIPPEALGKIFDAYYSTKKGGTGLGLAMSRRIILEHGGTLTARSEPGKGTDFTLRVPLNT